MDLISRQAAIDALRVAYWDDNIQSAKDDPCIVDAMTDWAIRQVKELPSAEPERKKGRWIPVDSFSAFGGDEELWMAHGNPVAFYYCSNCREQAYVGEDGQSLITDFCPKCGADMRGE